MTQKTPTVVYRKSKGCGFHLKAFLICKGQYYSHSELQSPKIIKLLEKLYIEMPFGEGRRLVCIGLVSMVGLFPYHASSFLRHNEQGGKCSNDHGLLVAVYHAGCSLCPET